MNNSKVFDGQRGLVMAIFVASVFVNLLVLTAPLYMLQLFTRVIGSGSMSTLFALSLGAGIALIFFFMFDMLRQRLLSRLASRIEARVGPVILNGLLTRFGMDEVQASQPIRDLQEVRSFVGSPFFVSLLDAPWSIIFIAVIFMFNPILGMVATAGVIWLFMLGVASELTGRKPSEDASKASRKTNENAEEMLRNADIIRAMGKGPSLIERWTAHSFSSMVFNTLANDRVALMTSLAKFSRMGLQIILMGAGVVLVIRGEMNAGMMIAASILLGRAAAPVEQSISGWKALMSARESHARLNTILGSIAQQPDRMELPEPTGRLSVENATVVVPHRQDPLLFDVSFKLEPGQSMGLIGPSGAGKTTLARALVGLAPLSRGHIRVDDAALTDWPSEQIGQYVGFLPQRVDLFQGTIAENIAMMDPHAKPSDVVDAAKLAEVHDLILTLPGGYNAQVGPHGEFLSAGQRQRIGLARSFFGDRRIVVLDEPNANLDPEGEEALARAVETATSRGAIVIVITHRMSILRRVTHAGLMQNGRMQRFGTARDILETSAQLNAPSASSAPNVTPIKPRPAQKDVTPDAAKAANTMPNPTGGTV